MWPAPACTTTAPTQVQRLRRPAEWKRAAHTGKGTYCIVPRGVDGQPHAKRPQQPTQAKPSLETVQEPWNTVEHAHSNAPAHHAKRHQHERCSRCPLTPTRVSLAAFASVVVTCGVRAAGGTLHEPGVCVLETRAASPTHDLWTSRHRHHSMVSKHTARGGGKTVTSHATSRMPHAEVPALQLAVLRPAQLVIVADSRRCCSCVASAQMAHYPRLHMPRQHSLAAAHSMLQQTPWHCWRRG